MNNKEIEQSAIERFGIPRKLEDVNEEELRQAVAECKSAYEIRLLLNIHNASTADIIEKISHLGISTLHFVSTRMTLWDNFSINQLQKICSESCNFQQVARKLGYKGHNISSIRSFATRDGIDCSHFITYQHAKNEHTYESVKAIVDQSRNISEIARKMHCKTSKAVEIANHFGIKVPESQRGMSRWSPPDNAQEIVNSCTTFIEAAQKLGVSSSKVHALLDKNNISYKHFEKYKSSESKLKKGTNLSGATLRNILFSQGRDKCEKCGCSTWQDKELVLQVHHINSCHNDNRIENLALLCPTCHAQIEGRGIKDLNFAAIKQSRSVSRGRCCDYCEQDSWLNGIIPLEAHHLDGNNANNCPDNIVILCPNCHSQTENFCQRGRPNKRISDEILVSALKHSHTIGEALTTAGLSRASRNYERARTLIQQYKIINHQGITKGNISQIIDELLNLGIDYIVNHRNIKFKTLMRIINGTHKLSPDDIDYPLPINISNEERALFDPDSICPKCGEIKSKTANTCIHCTNRKTIERPSREILKESIRSYGFCGTARLYGVTDNTIRKWCSSSCLPTSSQVIKQISDEDWEQDNFDPLERPVF